MADREDPDQTASLRCLSRPICRQLVFLILHARIQKVLSEGVQILRYFLFIFSL